MKLFIRLLKDIDGMEDQPKGSESSLALVTEQGELLPGQHSSSFVSNHPGDIPKFTVTFFVRDGGVIFDPEGKKPFPLPPVPPPPITI